MPIYEYRAKILEKSCSYCKNGFDYFQTINSSPLITCPNCGSEVVRIFHPTPTVRDSSDRKILSDDNLRKHGFKKLVNVGDGKFEEAV